MTRSAGRRRTCTVASVITPEPALAAEHHLAHARARRGRGHRPRRQQPRRRDHADRPREVGDVAVAVGLHARGARRDPAAERGVGEGVREVPERPAALGELALEVRPEHPRLHAREPRDRVDVEHPREPGEVERHDRPRLRGRRLEAPGDARPAAERDQHRVGVEHRAARRPRRRPRPRAARRRRAAARARRGAGARDRAGSCRARARRGPARRSRRPRRARARARSDSGRFGAGTSRSPNERTAPPGRVTSMPSSSRMNGASPGLSSCVNSTPGVAPPPPLHRGPGRPRARVAGRSRGGHRLIMRPPTRDAWCRYFVELIRTFIEVPDALRTSIRTPALGTFTPTVGCTAFQ